MEGELSALHLPAAPRDFTRSVRPARRPRQPACFRAPIELLRRDPHLALARQRVEEWLDSRSHDLVFGFAFPANETRERRGHASTKPDGASFVHRLMTSVTRTSFASFAPLKQSNLLQRHASGRRLSLPMMSVHGTNVFSHTHFVID